MRIQFISKHFKARSSENIFNSVKYLKLYSYDENYFKLLYMAQQKMFQRVYLIQLQLQYKS